MSHMKDEMKDEIESTRESKLNGCLLNNMLSVANDLKNQKGQEMINEELQLQAPQGNDDALKEERHKQPNRLK